MSASKAAKASSWLILRKVWGSMLNLLVTIYLARILPQSDFGIVAISIVLISFCSVISSSGMADYLVYYQGDDFDKVKVSTFWLNILIGTLMALVIGISAPYWGRVYGDVKITYIVWLFIIPFISEIVNNVPKATMKKNIDYLPMIKIQSALLGVAILLRFVLAYCGAGVYSLVLPTVIIDPLTAYLLFRKSGLTWKEVWQLKGVTKYWKSIFGFTKFLLLQRLLNRVVNEFDNLFVGKSISLAALACYNQAFILANLMTSHVSSIFTELLLPVFSKFQNDLDKLRDAYSKVIALLSFFGVMLLIILTIGAPQLILLLLGPKFSPAIFPLQMLSFFAFFRMINSPSGNVFSSMGKPQTGFYFVLIFTPIFIASVVFSGQWGLDIFAMCISGIRIIGSIISIWIATRLIKATSKGVLMPIVPFALAGLLAALAGYFANMILFEPFRDAMMQSEVRPFKSTVWWNTALGFATNCLIIVSVYIAALKVFFRSQWQSIIDYLSMMNNGLAKLLAYIR